MPSDYHIITGHKVTGPAYSDVTQGKKYFVDNSAPNASDSNDGLSLNSPKLTIQSAIDAGDANSGNVVYVMGSPISIDWESGGHHALTGTALYGVYREKLNIYHTDHGLQLIGINRPLITGQVGTTQDLTGHTPTIQIGSVGVASSGPKNVRISGFYIGGYGDDGDDAENNNAYGAAIAIGQYNHSYAKQVNYTIIEDCIFRSTNCAAAGQTNDEPVHTWIKQWASDKTTIRDCVFAEGQHAIGFLGSTAMQAYYTRVERCRFMEQATYSVYCSGSPYACTIDSSYFNPTASGKELNLTSGQIGCGITNSYFPLCNASVETGRDTLSSESIGTHTGWNVMGCRGKKGHIFAEG